MVFVQWKYVWCNVFVLKKMESLEGKLCRKYPDKAEAIHQKQQEAQDNWEKLEELSDSRYSIKEA